MGGLVLKAKKRIILTIIILLLVFLTFVLALIINSNNKNITSKAKIETAVAISKSYEDYGYKSSDIEQMPTSYFNWNGSDNVDNLPTLESIITDFENSFKNKVHYISTKAQLTAFSQIINGKFKMSIRYKYWDNGFLGIGAKWKIKEDNDFTYYGFDFTGCTVILTNNIYEYQGESLGYGDRSVTRVQGFNGTFDGCGYSICKSTRKYVQITEISGQMYVGLFGLAQENSVIKNLKVSGIKLVGSSSPQHYGGLVGLGFGIIENCEVENLIVSSSSQYTGDYVSAFAGRMACGSIKNCYFHGSLDVSGMKSPTTIATAYQENSNSIHFTQVEINNCVIDSGSFSNVLYRQALNIKACSNIYVNGTKYNAAAKAYQATAQTFDSYNSLSSSSTGGTSGSTWYKNDNYNSGKPILRSFISWDEVKFVSNNADYGSINGSNFYIPSGATINSFANSTSKTISLFGNTITASENTGYEFKYWSLSGTTYTANFDVKKCWVNINIYNPDNVEDYVTAKMTIVYSVDGQNITHNEMVNEAYSSSDPKTTVGSTITISNIQIIMANPDRYYVAEIRDGAGNTYNTTSFIYTVTSSSSQEINIYVRLKEYSVIFE